MNGIGLTNCVVKIKAGPDAGLNEGEFIAYASVFGNRDSYDDVVQKGAFTGTLAEWAKGDNPIPLLWGHNMSDPDYNIGHLLSAEEDERGLKVHGVIDMQSPKGPQVYRLLKSGRVGQMSFAYDVIKEQYVDSVSEDNGDGTKTVTPGYWSLEELKLYEVSVVPIGANQETEILAVKSAAGALLAKAGKVLSAKNEATIRDTVEKLSDAAEALKSLLPADGDEDEESSDDEEKDQDQTSGKGTAPGDAKSAGKATPDRPSVSLALDLLEAELSVASA